MDDSRESDGKEIEEGGEPTDRQGEKSEKERGRKDERISLGQKVKKERKKRNEANGAEPSGARNWLYTAVLTQYRLLGGITWPMASR